jgi:hypothetical protein
MQRLNSLALAGDLVRPDGRFEFAIKRVKEHEPLVTVQQRPIQRTDKPALIG